MSESRCNILENEAALNALKRHQLQSLTKRYGVKSNGKNSEMVQRLQEFAQTMSPDREIYSPDPSSTPGPNDFFHDSTSDDTNDTPIHQPRPIAQICQPGHQPRRAKFSTGSETWEMLSDSGASLLSPQKEKEGKSDSMRSWKSARNGQKLEEFGGGGTSDTVPSGSMSSIKSMASSLKRSASQHLMSRSRRNSINMLASEPEPIPVSAEAEVVEEIESLPPSPASTVGVPRRYSGMSLLERPSTVRLVASPPPPEPESEDEADDLPFVGTKSIALLKKRRSMAPLRSMDGAFSPTSLSRKSMPAISATTSASVPNIYPPLPPIPAQFQKPRVPSTTLAGMPGALPPSPKKPSPFVFGSPDNGVSNTQFSEAGKAILAQMNAKMPDGLAFNEELLKGRGAGVDKLVKTTSALGEGGWGLAGSSEMRTMDRYAEAHQREFSKMRSISRQNLGSLALSTSTSTKGKAKASTVTLNAGFTPNKRKRSSVHLPSAPNGAALPPTEAEQEIKAPEAKKKRMSYLGSLADAGRSLLSLEGSEKGKRPKRRSSLLPGGFKSKFGWLSRKKKSIPPATVRVPIMPRKTSVYAPRDPPIPKPVFDLNASLTKGTTTSKRDPTDYMSPTIAQKQRQASSSAQTVLSVSTARSRSRIPDFGPPSATPNNSLNTLGLPKPTGSMASSMRKQSQAEILKKVRPAPAPPATSGELSQSTSSLKAKKTSTIPSSSSRLYAPTASSLARMQATVKPGGARPLPVAPRTASASTTASSSAIPPVPPIPGPFSNASSRDNVLFQSNFNVSKPVKPSSSTSQGQGNGLKKGKSTSQLKSPLKSAPSSRLRSQASGLNAVKSRPDMKKEREIQARKAEIRARQERVGEERELRAMLGQEGEGDRMDQD